MLTFNRQLTVTSYNPYASPKESIQSTSMVETNQDTRSSLVRTTPHAKWRPPTNYERYVDSGFIKCVGVEGSCRYRISGGSVNNLLSTTWVGSSNFGGTYYDGVPVFPSNLENQAIIKARLKLKNQKVNLGQAFAERGQTVRLVGSTLTRLVELVHNVKRRRFPKKEDFFDYWLELQYGWKPLLSDVYGSVQALHEREKEADRGKVCVKSFVKSKDRTERVVYTDFGVCHTQLTKVRNIEHKGMIRLDFVQSNAPLTGTLSQVGITNPLELAWELLPWSFVADWFVPVGDYLSVLDATLGWDFLGGSFSQKTTVKSHPTSARVNPSGSMLAPLTHHMSSSGEGRQVHFKRKTYGSPPLPTLPSLSKLGRSSPEHVQNGIALLMSAIVGKSRVR